MGQADTPPPPGLQRPPMTSPRLNGEKQESAGIKAQHAAEETNQLQPQPTKRSHANFDEDNANDSTSDRLVSNWLDGVYPPGAKRRRRFSTSAIGGREAIALGEKEASCPDDCNGNSRADNSDVEEDGRNTRNESHSARAKSEPIMPPASDHVFARPLTPGSQQSSQWTGTPHDRARSVSRGRASSRGAGTTSSVPSVNLVDSGQYRRLNLDFHNGIKMRDDDSPLPPRVQSLVDVLYIAENPPTPTDEDRQRVKAVKRRNNGYSKPIETSIRGTFDLCVFPKPDDLSPLMRTDSLFITKAALPMKHSPAELKLLTEEERQDTRISVPAPDILFGYNPIAFPLNDQVLLRGVLGKMEQCNTDNLILPFLLVEFKGDGGSMWACENQCLGGGATCVNISHKLHTYLLERTSDGFNSVVFVIAMNLREASIHACWKPARGEEGSEDLETEYCMQLIGAFLLLDAQHFANFRQFVHNIIEWGMKERLEAVEKAIILIGKKRKRCMEDAKPAATPS